MSARVGGRSPNAGQLISGAILLAFTAACAWWSALAVQASEQQDHQPWPTVCSVVQPEDLDR